MAGSERFETKLREMKLVPKENWHLALQVARKPADYSVPCTTRLWPLTRPVPMSVREHRTEMNGLLEAENKTAEHMLQDSPAQADVLSES